MKQVSVLVVLFLCAGLALGQAGAQERSAGQAQPAATPSATPAGSQSTTPGAAAPADKNQSQSGETQLALPEDATHPASARAQDRIVREVRHELVMLPNYSLWDNLEYRVDGETVTLLGQVHDPVLKQDAERVVQRIEGVEKVNNQLEVLPTNQMDDEIRVRMARAIFGNSVLSRYSWGAVPPIHIIVNRGKVTLTGVVDNQNDKQIAGIQANSVPGVFAVKNELRVENESTARK